MTPKNNLIHYIIMLDQMNIYNDSPEPEKWFMSIFLFAKTNKKKIIDK